MITSHERFDLVDIMKINQLALSDSNTAHLEFSGQVKGKDCRVTILVVENLPQVSIRQNGKEIYSETVKCIDKVKIFLEERLYQFFEVQLADTLPKE